MSRSRPDVAARRLGLFRAEHSREQLHIEIAELQNHRLRWDFAQPNETRPEVVAAAMSFGRRVDIPVDPPVDPQACDTGKTGANPKKRARKNSVFFRALLKSSRVFAKLKCSDKDSNLGPTD